MKDIYKSPRFWLLVVTAGLQALVVFKILDGDKVESLVQIVQALILGVVTIRTVDKVSESKANTTTVNLPENVQSVTATTTPTQPVID